MFPSCDLKRTHKFATIKGTLEHKSVEIKGMKCARLIKIINKQKSDSTTINSKFKRTQKANGTNEV